MAFESLWQARQDGLLDQISFNEMVKAYKKGVAKGILKVMAKMGISTLQSYKGAQIFEAVGLADEIIEKCFPGTASRVQGVDFNILINEMERRHELGFPLINKENIEVLPNPGDFHWRQGGDSHMWDPETISDLQQAARNNNEDSYWKFSNYANKQTTKDSTLRGLLKFKYTKKPLDLNEVLSLIHI